MKRATSPEFKDADHRIVRIAPRYLADGLSELEKTSGRDLKAWSAKWLEESGINKIGRASCRERVLRLV